MTEDILDLADFTQMLPIPDIGSVSLARVAEEQQGTLSALKTFHPLRLAATFAGLLTVPELQSNCIRLEALVHLSLAGGRGHRKPNDRIIAGLFADFGKGRLGLQEDPAEDVFVSLVCTPRGNFRVLEGVWESGGFYLQRVLNALQLVPSGRLSDQMTDRVYALLRLSDAVCERAKLARYQLGNQIPQDKLDGKITRSLSSLRRIVRFKEDELAELLIRPEHLAEFGFDPGTRTQLVGELIGHSTLERHPVAHQNGEYFLLLPTAVSAAIRRCIIEGMQELGLRDAFVSTMGYEYAQMFSETLLLGTDLGAPIEFKRTEAGLLAGVMTRADRGLFINFIFLADTLEAFDQKGLIGIYSTGKSVKLDETIEQWIDDAYDTATKEPDFREGLTILVCCGIGRSMSIYQPQKRSNWRFEFLDAPDLMTLSWLEEFKPISLWRLIESQERLSNLGVTLQNINGLLNIVGWARSLGGHLIPHGDMPEEFGQGDVPAFVMVQQNAIREVRHEVAARWDPHVIQDARGRWVNVRKDSGSLFAEDASKPFYVADEARTQAQWPRCVYESRTRPWWVELRTAPGTNGHLAYQRSVMLRTWLCRMVPVLEAVLQGLPKGPLLWRVEFNGILGDMESQSKQEFLTYETALAAVAFELPREGNTVALSVAQEFEHALFHPENIAERALVARAVEAFVQLAGSSLSNDKQDSVVQEIVQDAGARQAHAFIARHFRDFVRDSLWRTPVKADADDAAWLKLGLGWRKRAVSEGGDIPGKENCTAYLNAIVRELEDEVCTDLRELDRRAVITFALQNHESAIFDRDNWRRTAAAVLALHNDRAPRSARWRSMKVSLTRSSMRRG